jgi:DinB superfamily
MLVDAKTLRSELLAVNTEAAALCEGLTGDQLAWRPNPAKWSIAENLIHLCKTTEIFLPALDEAIMEYRRRGLLGVGAFSLGWYGRLLVWYVEPPPVIRLPAPKALRVEFSEAPERALDKFLLSQAAMIRRIDDADSLNLSGLRFASPLASYVRMNLLEFFSVFNGHSRRHLWQASNVRRDLATLIDRSPFHKF